jgi:hypothetical protein
MSTNGQFFSSFVFTLYVVGILVSLSGMGFITLQAWRFSQPLRGWLQRSWFASLIREAGTMLAAAMIRIEGSVMNLFTVLIVHPWRAFITLLVAFGSLLRRIQWGICIGVLVAYSLPLPVFVISGMPLWSVIGVVAAGALIGVFCAPFVGWHYRKSGFSKAVGSCFLTIVVGTWGSSMLISILIALASG